MDKYAANSFFFLYGKIYVLPVRLTQKFSKYDRRSYLPEKNESVDRQFSFYSPVRRVLPENPRKSPTDPAAFNVDACGFFATDPFLLGVCTEVGVCEEASEGPYGKFKAGDKVLHVGLWRSLNPGS